MIALDTNILVRFLTKDDPPQSILVRAVMLSLTAQNPAWVGLAVMQQLVWVLTSIFGASRSDVVTVLKLFLTRKELLLEQSDVVRHSVRIYEDPKVEFSDCLISASAQAAGFKQILTFDQLAAKTAGMTLVP